MINELKVGCKRVEVRAEIASGVGRLRRELTGERGVFVLNNWFMLVMTRFFYYYVC